MRTIWVVVVVVLAVVEVVVLAVVEVVVDALERRVVGVVPGEINNFHRTTHG